MAFQLIDLLDGGQIKIGESSEPGSFTRTEGENPSITVKLNIWGAENASTAYIALMNFLAQNCSDGNGGIANYDLPLDTVTISTTSNPYAYTAECVFQYRADYSNNSNDTYQSNINEPKYTLPDIEDADYSFETTGGSAHVRYALARVASARYDGTTPLDYGLLVNPRDDGTSEGADVVVPTMGYSISLSLPKQWFSAAYRSVIANCTGSVNATPWGGHPAGCVLFKGVNASAKWMTWTNLAGMSCRDWYWRATFSFEAAAVQSIVVGNTTLVKAGFQYASQCSASYADPATGTTVNVVEQVDIMQMYPVTEFRALKLPMP